jgi:hypothetical protein
VVTDIRLRQPNDTNREVGLHRSIQRATGNGCACRLGDEQIKSFAHRVRMYAHLSGESPASVVGEIGLRGEAAAQVLAALEAE